MPHLILPLSWVHVMSRVRSVLPSAFLAGGALRDLDNMRPVKDFDVFFTDDFNINDLDMALEGSYEYYRHCPGEYMDAAKEVMDTLTFNSCEGMPQLNLIRLDKSFNPADIVMRVDFGLCQIGYDLMVVTTTEEYERDKRNMTLTLTRAETVQAVQRSLRRYDRLSQKYQGWALVVPQEHQEVFRAAVEGDASLTDFVDEAV